MEKGTKRILLVVLAIIGIVGLVVALDYLQKAGQHSKDYVSTSEGDIPAELADDTSNIFDPSIPADYAPVLDEKTIRKYVQQAKDAYPGDANKELRERWIAEVAFAAKNPLPCEDINDSDIRDSCYFGVAIDTNNANLCGKVLYGKSDCYVTVAVQTGNGTICEFADYEHQICLEAAQKKDMSLCAKIGDFREYCNNAAFPGCDNSTFKEGTCTDVGNSLPPGDIKECDKMPEYKSFCYSQVAITKGDPSLCSKAADKEDCYNSVGVEFNNVNACNLAGQYKDGCIAWVAFNTNNVSLCEKAGSEKQACIEDITYQGEE